jgi:hypothetical protein
MATNGRDCRSFNSGVYCLGCKTFASYSDMQPLTSNSVFRPNGICYTMQSRQSSPIVSRLRLAGHHNHRRRKHHSIHSYLLPQSVSSSPNYRHRF